MPVIIYFNPFYILRWLSNYYNLHFYLPFYLYLYINLSLPIICYVFSGNIYFSFDISIHFSSVFEEVFELLCGVVLLILSTILLLIRSPVASANFWVIIAIFHEMIHWQCYRSDFSLLYFCIVYFAYAVSKWSTKF